VKDSAEWTLKRRRMTETAVPEKEIDFILRSVGQQQVLIIL